MESNGELKEIDIINRYFNFNGINTIEDFGNIFFNEIPYENVLVYNVSYKALIGAKLLRIRFDKVDGFIRGYDRTGYLVLFGPEKYDGIQNRIEYLVSEKISITYVSSHNYARIKIYSYDSLPLEKKLALDNVKKPINSVFYKNQKHYYYNIFLEKTSY